MTNLERVDQIIAEITAQFSPDAPPRTSEPWDVNRAERLDSIATQIHLTGGQTKERTDGRDS